MRILLLAVAMLVCACTQSPGDNAAESEAAMAVDTAHSSRNALDWPGRYSGVLPCADCDGIRTVVTLNADGTYEREQQYLGRSDTPSLDRGRFDWDEHGQIVTLGAGGNAVQRYFVGENRLFHLDRDGHRITGDLADRYVLAKARRDPRIEDRKWLLTEVMGNAVDTAGDSTQPFLLLSSHGSRVTGNASCNGFFGTYTLEEGDRIRFGDNLGSTMMACPDMSVEQAFHEAMRKVDNYSIQDDRLTLNRARMAPLLAFELARDE